MLKSDLPGVAEQTAEDLALDELESNMSVDEDAVPARKVVINNRVSPEILSLTMAIEGLTQCPLIFGLDRFEALR